MAVLVLVKKLARDGLWAFVALNLLLFIFSGLWVKIAQRITTEIAPFFNLLGAAQGVGKEIFEEVVFKGPGKITQAVLGGSGIQFERPDDFLAVELLHPVVVILVTLWAVGRSGAAIAGEIDRGTMELLLAQPVRRYHLIVAHFLVDLVTIPLVCLTIYLGTQLGLAVVGPFTVDYSVLSKLPGNFQPLIDQAPKALPVQSDRQPGALVNLAALMFALSGLSLMISSFGRSRWRSVGFATLTAVLMFTVNVLGQLYEQAGAVRFVTVYYYYQPQTIWLKGDWSVPLGSGAVNGSLLLAGVGLAGYAVATLTFCRRDIPAPL